MIWRMVPSAGNRRALLERGDADISYDLPNKDFVELKDAGKLNIISTPFSNGMPVSRHERHQAAVRQSQGSPGGRLRDAVSEDHGRGAVRPRQADVRRDPATPTEVAWPQPHKFNTDIAKAKQLMAEAGYPNGFETTLSFDLGFATVNEPLCVLVQESLGQIGIKATINKIPGRDLAHRAEQEDAAALHQRVLGLARLSRVLLHLVLSRQEFDLQHDELPVARRSTASSTARVTRGGRRQQGELRQGREGLRRSGLQGHAAHSAVPALRQRRDAEERLRLPVLVPPAARLSRLREGLGAMSVMPGVAPGMTARSGASACRRRSRRC